MFHAQLVKKFLAYYGPRRFITVQIGPPLSNRVLNQTRFSTISVQIIFKIILIRFLTK